MRPNGCRQPDNRFVCACERAGGRGEAARADERAGEGRLSCVVDPNSGSNVSSPPHPSKLHAGCISFFRWLSRASVKKCNRLRLSPPLCFCCASVVPWPPRGRGNVQNRVWEGVLVSFVFNRLSGAGGKNGGRPVGDEATPRQAHFLTATRCLERRWWKQLWPPRGRGSHPSPSTRSHSHPLFGEGCL